LRLDRRILVPAALTTAALAFPAAGAAALPDTHVFCPNNGDLNSAWIPQSTIVAPASAEKDNNGDTLVCQKIDNPEPVKDNNNPLQSPLPSLNPNDYTDNIVL
jgi:hypothetical protein